MWRSPKFLFNLNILDDLAPADNCSIAEGVECRSQDSDQKPQDYDELQSELQPVVTVFL